jgi:hypothetical protein
MVVKNLSETWDAEKDRLVILSDQEIVSVPLYRCHSDKKVRNCGDCVGLQDPHCGWDVETETCVSDKKFEQNLIRNVETGDDKDCPGINAPKSEFFRL